MRDVILSPAAKADLDNIAISTKDRWGAEQALKYIDQLEADIEGLTLFPEKHAFLQSRYGRFRKAQSGEHLIFYMVGEDAIDVVRILHTRMDQDARLD